MPNPSISAIGFTSKTPVLSQRPSGRSVFGRFNQSAAMVKTAVRRSGVHLSVYLKSSLIFSCVALSFCRIDAIRAQQPAATQSRATDKGYEVLSVTPNEVIVKITPTYQTKIVQSTSGKSFTEMTFSGGAIMDSTGSPEMPRLILPFLAPDRTPASVEIVSQSLEVLPNVDLAPVPTYTKKGDDYTKQFVVNSARYSGSSSAPLFVVQLAGTFRTAFTQHVVVAPIQYEAPSHSVTRVRSLTLRIRFSNAAGATASAQVSPSEADMYRNIFINGSVASYYGQSMPAVKRSPQISAQSASGSGTWLQLETTDEGVYRITAQNFADAGITGTVDPNSIELFGIGAELLNENITDSSGEWIERPIEVRQSGSNFDELYFYTHGPIQWKYSHGGDFIVVGNDTIRGEWNDTVDGQPLHEDGVYHRSNPYGPTGHFFLKVGGDPIGHHLRVSTIADQVTSPLSPATNRVLAAAVHEVDHYLESPNFGRELLDGGIPREDVGPITFDIPAPGFTSDSTTIRIGYDASIVSTINHPDSGFVAVQVNGQHVGTINARSDSPGTLMRDWNNSLALNSGIGAPVNVGLTFTSSNVTATAVLDFAELMYRRSTDIGGGSIPFMVVDTKQAFQYDFSNAASGEVWDVTSPYPTNIGASVSGSTMTATIQGVTPTMRRFVAFTPQSASAPHILALKAPPSLRNTVGATGATEIIVAAQDFLDAANVVKTVREKGGQATEPITTTVVNIEDIYREFGYGNRDVTAIRDFMAYTFRHTQDPTRRPVYLLLIGTGHCDFQNHQTNVPERIPPYENPESEYLGTFRQNVPGGYPDDSYFGRLRTADIGSDQAIDVAVGRVSATSVQDADGFAVKIQHYEHGSDTGAWRSLATFLADDRIADDPTSEDLLDHFGETEGEVNNVPNWVTVKKLYEVSYPTVYSTAGRQKPTCEKALVDAINGGTALFSFIGHGNPGVWTHEGILTVPSTINRFNNFDRLTYLTTATCDFSSYDNFSEVSGGELFLLKPDGGAIGVLGTSRSVTEEPELTAAFYSTLLNVDPTMGYGTTSVGTAFLAGKRSCVSGNLPYFYLLGDPAQRLLIPKLFVNFDSINGQIVGTDRLKVPALSQVQISGSIGQGLGISLLPINTFNGRVTVTLYDTRTQVTATTNFPNSSPVVDRYMVDGPILYRGSAVVTNGRFSISFILPKDVKLDTASAKLSGYAYAEDTRSAAGVLRDLQLVGSDPNQAIIDTTGPSITVYIGSRSFQSGDAVSKHSMAIVDVSDLHGLNTSTSSVGHSFIAWVDDAQDASTDMASTYVPNPGDFTAGSSAHAIELPAGHHKLNVRAFDVFDNPSFASVDFVAKNEAPYELYNVTSSPNPLLDHTTFSFVQPGQAGSLVDITITLYTVDGRRARTLSAQTRESSIDVLWDGRDDAGNTVANGVYVFTVNAHNLDDGTTSQAQGKCIVAR